MEKKTDTTPTWGSAEVAQLARSFDNLSAKLKESTVSKNYMNNILNSLNEILLVLDQEGQIKYINPVTQNTLCIPLSQLLGKNIVDLLPSSFDKKRFLNHLQTYPFSHQEVTLVTATHKEIPTLFSSSVLKSPYHQENQIVCSALDISALKKIEKKQTLILKELKESNQELEQFAYVASHDLQTPLRHISSFTELLRQKIPKGDPETEKWFQFVLDGTLRAHNLINDLLFFSRIGRKDTAFVESDLNQILENVLVELEEEIKKYHVVVESDTLPKLTVVPNLIYQLFHNLLSNAIKFRSSDRPLHITISSEKRPQGWQFCIADTGIGIDPEYHQRIFLIFQKLHTRDEYPGTGIGLAICKKIVSYHRGEIFVSSEKEKGSKFYFTLSKTLTVSSIRG